MTDTPAAPAPSDALRFAFGTLTVLPVRVTRWDREAARGGMLCAPLAGLVVGLCAAALGAALLLLGGGPLLAAVATAVVPAVLTRGLHLDGLADTADGLGSGKPAEEALRIMKQSDIGPFGVVTLLFALLAQVAALDTLYAQGWARGAVAAAVAAVTARCALTLASRAGVRPPAPRVSARRSRAPSRYGRRCCARGWWPPDARPPAPRSARTARCTPGSRRCSASGWASCCCGTAGGGSAG